MPSFIRFACGVLAAACLAAPACAAGLEVSGAWFRTLPGALPSAGYFRIHNSGALPAVLTGARSAACGALTLHKSGEKGGMSRMRDVQRLTIAPGTTFVFAPGGYHLMCMRPAAGMVPGNTVHVTLVTAGGGIVDARFAVKTATGK